MTPLKRAAIAVLATLSIPAASPAQEQHSPRPRLALVLSGGGARGAAHIGVLKVLEELHVVPDLVVGTSMGSIVGGLYAAGWSPERIEELLVSTDWNEVFFDRVARPDRPYRRKLDDVGKFVPTKVRFKGVRPYVPPGVLGGQKLELLLRSLEFQSTDVENFDTLPIPYRAVATDLESGETVVIDDGHLADAMRASMSIPGAFAPVEYKGRLLVDGGSSANLPVGVAQQLGAERIVAVDITSPLDASREELGTFLSVFGQINNFVTVTNRVKDVARLRPGDIYIRPELADITFASFERATEAVGIGERAARDQVEALRSLATDEDGWQAFRSRHRTRPAEELTVDSFHLVNLSRLADEVVQRRLPLRVGVTLDDLELRRRVLALASLDVFGTIRPEFRATDGLGELTVTVPPKPYGRHSLQFGVGFSDDFRGDTSNLLAVRHQVYPLNRLGGEWQNTIQIGDVSLAHTEFYQPLDPGLRWFVAPSGFVRREHQPLWLGDTPISEYTLERAEARLTVGRVLGNWGAVQAAAFLASSHGEPRIGLPGFSKIGAHLGGYELLATVDTRESVVFPRHGTYLSARYTENTTSLGSDFDFRQAYLFAAQSLTFGRTTVRPAIEVGYSLDQSRSLFGVFPLGGFLRLSGFGREELRNDHSVLGRLLVYHELTALNLGVLSARLFVGGSAERGNTFAKDSPITFDALRWAGSVFIGADTILGPVYVAYGVAEGDRRRFYLTIGERF